MESCNTICHSTRPWNSRKKHISLYAAIYSIYVRRSFLKIKKFNLVCGSKRKKLQGGKALGGLKSPFGYCQKMWLELGEKMNCSTSKYFNFLGVWRLAGWLAGCCHFNLSGVAIDPPSANGRRPSGLAPNSSKSVTSKQKNKRRGKEVFTMVDY